MTTSEAAQQQIDTLKRARASMESTIEEFNSKIAVIDAQIAPLQALLPAPAVATEPAKAS